MKRGSDHQLHCHSVGAPYAGCYIASLFGLTLVATLGFSSSVLAQQCQCGPDFCPNDPRIANALQQKKAKLKSAGFEMALIDLLDKADRCVAAIERAPDTFSLMTVGPSDTITVINLTQDNERIAKKNLQDGKLLAYYKFNVREAAACCNRPKASARSDWNQTLELSAGQAIACTLSGGSVACK